MAVGKQGLLQAALCRFALDGYAGASLKDIAEEAGIKKPSIYAHFQGKDDLFLHVLEHCVIKVKRKIRRFYLHQLDEPLSQRLKGLLSFLQDSYHQDRDTQFLLRTFYFPPQELYAEVLSRGNPFLDGMEQMLTLELGREIQNRGSSLIEPAHAATAYMTLADGVLLDMLYEIPERSRRRLELSWPVYWKGIQR
ncbi:TetR/AcrR family transcriptional regulator [Paenibacillus sp. CAA11]|uniref:TetR/AcrR family transcriptional regulator n=1 Tax=Paenibacillus sp. CAA11 TaxID=1532905 RepID=UPI000D37F759|nr:TetR/AcrR family transcriptional regulator [Paenibacillus sp. CAA11]AWB46294.1 TetR/AcrR family transcriptional regulator [Paenibacillus sp. CAA11]